MKLSDHFWLSEFLRSSTAKRNAHQLSPSEHALNNLQRLAQDVLQPLRDILGSPIRITSGFRDAWLNAMIGGATKSAHTDGRAADLYCPGHDLMYVAELIAAGDIPFDKLIFEGDWIHIQVAKPGRMPRRLVYTATFGKDGVSYTTGLS